MTTNLELLERKARRAYELGRLRRSARVLFVLAPILVISALVCSNLPLLAVFGTLLSISSVLFLWRGEIFGEGARMGLLAGSIAFAVPTAFHVFGLCCKYDLEIATCIAAGIIAGVFITLKASRIGRQSVPFLISAGIVSTLTASLGCLAIGIGGALALSVGVLLITVPALFVLHARVA